MAGSLWPPGKPAQAWPADDSSLWLIPIDYSTWTGALIDLIIARKISGSATAESQYQGHMQSLRLLLQFMILSSLIVLLVKLVTNACARTSCFFFKHVFQPCMSYQ